MWGKSDEDVDGRRRKGICGERVMRMWTGGEGKKNMWGKSDEDVDGSRRKGICGERVMRMWTGGEGKEYVGKE